MPALKPSVSGETCPGCGTWFLYGVPADGCHYCARSRRAKRQRGKISAKTRRRVLRRDGNRCVVCGAEHDLTIDHKIPVARGGTHRLSNLQTLCRDCNQRKGVEIT